MKNLSFSIIVLFTIILSFSQSVSANLADATSKNKIEYSVLVFDINSKEPLQNVKVIIRNNNTILDCIFTEHSGKARTLNIAEGKYIIDISVNDYDKFEDTIEINAQNTSRSFGIQPSKTVQTSEVVATAYSSAAIQPLQMSTGTQLFDLSADHASPTSRITDLAQSAIIGAAKAPTGEMHIRGQHAEYTYYIDGVPVPLGVFGGLNEVVDTKAIERMTIYTGGFPAEYGGQTAAVMDVTTKAPSGKFHLDFSTYAGSYLVFNGAKAFSAGNSVASGQSSSASGDALGSRVGPFRALNSNGQSLSLSNHLGGLGYFLSFSRQETDRRVDIPTPTLYNDHGLDYFSYGKFDYQLSELDYLTLNLSYSDTRNETPFDVNEQGFSPDKQFSYNSFQNLSYYHIFSSETNTEKELFVGLFARQGGLDYKTSPLSPANFQFSGNDTLYSLSENRSFSTVGARVKFDNRLSSKVLISTGINFSATDGSADFTSRDSLRKSGPRINSNFTGSDFGMFAQMEYQPISWFRSDIGIRYDQQISPENSLQNAVSPRIKLNFYIDEQNTLYLYYGKLFMPNNIEGLRSLSSKIDTNGAATLPEKDDLFEIGYLRSFECGLSLKASVYYKYASPGVDDETIGSSAVKTPVNIETIKTSGIELGLAYTHPKYPITAFINSAIIHSYGSGKITGGFLAFDDAGTASDLDHDQRLSISAGVNYQPKDWFVSLASIYGSGLNNGNPNNSEVKTGLFDFNTGSHVSPYMIFNISGGYTIHLSGDMTIETSLYINNLFDNNYLLKGAYFSGANYGERRNVVFKLAVHI